MNANSVFLLLFAILILWLAVTDKLTRLVDAYHVLTGDLQASATVAPVATAGVSVVPTLPTIGTITIH